MRIFFDLDGTLTDSSQGIGRCFRHALTELGVESPDDAALLEYIGSPLPIRACFARLLQTQDAARLEEAVRVYRRRFEAVGIFENRLFPGVEAGLPELRRRGHVLFVVTAKPAPSALRICAHFGIDQYVDAIHGPEPEDHAFTKAALLCTALESSRITDGAGVVVGDRAADIEAARMNGLLAIGAAWGYGAADELDDADEVASTWDELMDSRLLLATTT